MNYYNKYIKYQLSYSLIRQVLKNMNKKKIIFYIDLQGICKGLYNKNNIFYELKHYIEHKQPSNTMVQEYKSFLNKLYSEFKQYSPFMVTFLDDGKNQQNIAINPNYKGGRSSVSSIVHDDSELQLYYQIKKLYFIKIEKQFTKERFGHVYHLKQYESDLIPYYCIDNDLFNSNDKDTLNVILSSDKDLLQCCSFRNTIQCVNRFFPSKTGNKRLGVNVYDDRNAISYIHPKFKIGSLTAKYIPMILAISGDKADNITGVKGYGPSKTISLIDNFDLPHSLAGLNKLQFQKKLPSIISNNFDKIVQNFKMISFKEQLKRTNITNITKSKHI